MNDRTITDRELEHLHRQFRRYMPGREIHQQRFFATIGLVLMLLCAFVAGFICCAAFDL